jgi:predicted N-formylglutamate amidohydrolase
MPNPRKSTAVIVTCEHGGNRIPPRWKKLFRGHEAVLRTHRGYDIGAALVAETLAPALDAPLFVATTSRLLVDLNRSLHHPTCFSEVTRVLPRDERERIVREYYTPHRTAVEDAIDDALRRSSRVVQLAVHSFTPSLHGVVRRADVGLLYDPRRAGERALAAAWKSSLREVMPEWVVRFNYPYRGAGDGFSTSLRRVHSASRYVGIEIEVNQGLLVSRAAMRRIGELLVTSVGALLSR